MVCASNFGAYDVNWYQVANMYNSSCQQLWYPSAANGCLDLNSLDLPDGCFAAGTLFEISVWVRSRVLVRSCVARGLQQR